MTETRQLFTFRLDHLFLAVDARDVKAVLSHQRLTRVPLAPKTVRGLMNLRGEVIAGIDLRACLELDAANGDRQCTNIVLKGSLGPVSLLVDGIGEVVTVAEDQLEPPPGTLHARTQEITDSVCQINGKMILLLDVKAVIETASDMEAEY